LEIDFWAYETWEASALILKLQPLLGNCFLKAGRPERLLCS
jgi:hypothetical protein